MKNFYTMISPTGWVEYDSNQRVHIEAQSHHFDDYNYLFSLFQHEGDYFIYTMIPQNYEKPKYNPDENCTQWIRFAVIPEEKKKELNLGTVVKVDKV